jgi:hypothetical protein
MFGISDILDVALGFVFVFLLLSLLATWVQELMATLFSWRSKQLMNIIQHLLDPSTEKLDGVARLRKEWAQGEEATVAQKLTDNAVKAFYEHPIIKGLAKPNEEPSYISTRDFGIVLLDLFTKAGMEEGTPAQDALDNLKKGIEKLDNSSTRDALLVLVETAVATEKDVEKQIVAARQSVEAWFDTAMDRASGWYKRTVQWWALAIGIVLVILFNADAIGLAQALWRDSALRETVSASAVAYIERDNEAKAKEAQQQLAEMGLPIGWSSQNLPSTPTGWLLKAFGWLVSGFAVSQGSPFWFDLLNRFVNIRGTGKKPEPATAGAG